MKIKSHFLLTFVFLLIFVFSEAQTIQLKKSVFGNGAGKIGGGEIKINSTLGQSFIGNHTNDANIGQAGFWNQLTGPVSAIENDPLFVSNEAGSLTAYPNPFSQRVTLVVSLDKSQDISLQIFNVNGEMIESLEEDFLVEGRHTYQFKPVNLSDGLYYCRLIYGKNIISEKLVYKH